ncbi:MAG: hypothetical protein ACOCP4_06930 [Candidatus Woesearchaeota archaeon]
MFEIGEKQIKKILLNYLKEKAGIKISEYETDFVIKFDEIIFQVKKKEKNLDKRNIEEVMKGLDWTDID